MQREPTEQWGYDEFLAALREILKEDEIAQLSGVARICNFWIGARAGP
jgi:hypothetical protein